MKTSSNRTDLKGVTSKALQGNLHNTRKVMESNVKEPNQYRSGCFISTKIFIILTNSQFYVWFKTARTVPWPTRSKEISLPLQVWTTNSNLTSIKFFFQHFYSHWWTADSKQQKILIYQMAASKKFRLNVEHFFWPWTMH